MNEVIIQRHNEIVKPEDIIYVLGDLCLGGGSEEMLQKNKELIERLNGILYIVRGNHDTDNRCKMYRSCKNVKQVVAAMYLNYSGYHFYLSHYPTLTGNLEKESLKQMTLNIYGHTHQTKSFEHNGVKIVENSLGYVDYDDINHFDKKAVLDI